MLDKFFPAKNYLGIPLIGIILTIIFTWPFFMKLDKFYYDYGDYPVSGSILAHNDYFLKTGKIFNKDEYFLGNEFYPQPYSLVYFDARVMPSLIFSPIYNLTGKFILSLNLVAFLTFIFSFIAAFYTIYFFARNFLASIVGAAIYTFNPLTLSRFPEHFDILNKYFLPLLFLFAYKYFTLPNIKNALLFFLAFTLNGLSSFYYQVFSLLLVPVFAMPFLIRSLSYKYLGRLVISSLILVIFVPVLVYFDSAYVDFSKREQIVRTLESNVFFSARVIDYFSPAKESFLYKNFVQSLEPFRAPKDDRGNFNYLEHSLSLNILPTLLFLGGLFFWQKNKKNIFRGQFLAPFLILLIVSFILTFGPYFQGWNSSSSSNIKLPFYYLYQLLPPLQSIRVPTRFLFIFYIPFSIFCAFGAYFIFKKVTKTYFAILVFLAILVGIWLENYTPKTVIASYNKTSEIIQKLDSMKLNNFNFSSLWGKETLHYPLYFFDSERPGLESVYLNWAAITGEKVVNGNGASFVPAEQINFLAGLNDKLDKKAFLQLSTIDVDYVIIHKNFLTNLGQFQEDYSFYKLASVYEDNELLIVDLSRYNFSYQKCDFDRDIELSFQSAFIPAKWKKFDYVKVRNKADCYLLSIYFDKYKSTNFSAPDILGNILRYRADFKMPVVIEPFQEVTLPVVLTAISSKK